MSSKLLPLIIQTTAPTGSENLAAGYHIGQQWMNTTTGAMYKCIGDGSWQQSYGYGDSPTFAGTLTATAAAGNNARIAVDNTGPIGVGGYNGFEFYETGVLKAVQYWDPSAARVTINAPFTLSSTSTSTSTTTGALVVSGGIGVGGAINAAGVVTAVRFSATADTNGIYNFLAPRNTNAGSNAYTISYWGNDVSAIEGYIILNSFANTTLAGAGSFNIGAAKALGFIAGGTVKVSISAAGIATFFGSAPITVNAGEVRIGGGNINAAGSATAAGGFFSPGARLDSMGSTLAMGTAGTWYSLPHAAAGGLLVLRSNAQYEAGLYLVDLGGGVTVLKAITNVSVRLSGSVIQVQNAVNVDSVYHLTLSFY